MYIGFLSLLIVYLGMCLTSTESKSFPDRHFPKKFPTEKTLEPEPTLTELVEPIYGPPAVGHLLDDKSVVQKESLDKYMKSRHKRALGLIASLALSYLLDRPVYSILTESYVYKSIFGGKVSIKNETEESTNKVNGSFETEFNKKEFASLPREKRESNLLNFVDDLKDKFTNFENRVGKLATERYVATKNALLDSVTSIKEFANTFTTLGKRRKRDEEERESNESESNERELNERESNLLDDFVEDLKDQFTNFENRIGKIANERYVATKNAILDSINYIKDVANTYTQLGKRRKREMENPAFGNIVEAITKIQKAFENFITSSSKYLQNSFQTFVASVIDIDRKFSKSVIKDFYRLQHILKTGRNGFI